MIDSYKYKNNISINKSSNLYEIKEENLLYPADKSPYKSNNNTNILGGDQNNSASNDRYGNLTFSTNNNDEVLQSTNPKKSMRVNLLKSSSCQYLSKVIIENLSSPEKAITLLDNFLEKNHYNINYQVNEGENKIEFIFIEEEVAFNFTKLIHQQKARSPSFYNVNVHLSLINNNNFGKGRNSAFRRRGLSPDSIQRLFQGLGVNSKIKEDKKMNKINGNLDLGISSPFLYPNERKKTKNNKICETEENINNIDYINKFKDYSRLPIRVLDTHYSPLADYNFRTKEKNRWISPSDFQY